MTRRRLAVLAFAALGACHAATAVALTKLEGEYQLMLDLRKPTSQRNYPWDFDSNNNDNSNRAELRLFSQPRTGVEAFLKLDADWHDYKNNTERPLLQYMESHVRFRWDLGNRGIDSYLFSRQDRFWVDNYLLRIVDSGEDWKAPLRNGSWGPNAQGVRIDTWGFLGANTSWIVSDFSGQFPSTRSVDQTDDAYVGRIRREFLDKRLRLGSTWTRVEALVVQPGTSTLSPERTEVLAFDSRYTIRNIDVSVEYAQSAGGLVRDDVEFLDGLDRPVTVFGRSTGLRLDDRSVLIGEIRSFKAGTPRLGYLNVAPMYWRRGPLWVDPSGDISRVNPGEQKNDETGWAVNSWYLLPERAVTWSTSYKSYTRHAFEKREADELYSEIYVEFVNGFTGKTYLKNYRLRRDLGFGHAVREYYNTWFGELQVESQLAWFRIQSKYKDIGHPFRKQLYAVETRINITDQLKTYNRFVFGNDPAGLRKAIFSQLQYYPSANVLLFLEYGPNWIGDAGTPVDDSDLEGGGDHVDMVKLILKGTF